MSKEEMNHEGHSHKSKLGLMMCYFSRAFAGVMPILVVILLALTVHMHYNLDKRLNNLEVKVFDLGKNVSEGIALNTDKLDIISNRTKVTDAVGGKHAVGKTLTAEQIQKLEQINMTADKYYVVVLTKDIMDNIDNTESFQAKLDELESSLEGRYSDYVTELRNYEKMSMMSFDEMVGIVENATVADVPVEQDKSVVDNVKGLFKVSDKDDLKIKCNPIIIDSAIKALSERNEWEALKVLEKIEPKNEDLKKVVANLTVRNTLKFYLRDIGDKILKDA